MDLLVSFSTLIQSTVSQTTKRLQIGVEFQAI